jgi:hypothetical protein
MNAQKKPTFKQFLDKFPVLALPLHLNEESHHLFSAQNLPLSALAIEQYILPFETEEEHDEFTEFVPCCQLPKSGDFVAVIYWRARLMDYRYCLATFTAKGAPIDSCALSGLKLEGDTLLQSVTSVETDGMLYVAEGRSQHDGSSFEAASSKARSFHLQPDGRIDRL